MIQAMITIEALVSKIDASDFGNYVINDISFMYYDMGNREAGEETFVIINTTGEPLTATQNLKPSYVNAQPDQFLAAEKWEEWENWFWQHRKGAGNKINDTAENGFKEFLRWITLLDTPGELKRIQESGNFNFNLSHSVDIIDQYFEIVQTIFTDKDIFGDMLDWLAPNSKENQNTQLVWFKLLPVIEYIKKWGFDNKRNIIRVARFFNNLARIERVSKTIGQILPLSIELIKDLKYPDIAKINDQNVSSQILSDEEKMKFDIYLSASDNIRRTLEDTFWQVEGHYVLNGEIKCMLNWASSSGTFDFQLFVQYNDVFNKLYHDNLDYPELDIVRRALLAQDLDAYPRFFRGNTNYSFCWEYSDWQSLISTNESKFGQFLNNLIGKSDIGIELQTIIDQFPDSKKWAEFIKIKELMEFCHKKNIQDLGSLDWVLIRNDNRRGEHANVSTYKLFMQLKHKYASSPGKIDMWFYDGSCVNFKHHNGIEIDIIYEGSDQFKIDLFNRTNHHMNAIDSFASAYNLIFNNERYSIKSMNEVDMLALIDQMILTL
jgi:hypothetical protein